MTRPARQRAEAEGDEGRDLGGGADVSVRLDRREIHAERQRRDGEEPRRDRDGARGRLERARDAAEEPNQAEGAQPRGCACPRDRRVSATRA